MARLITCQLLLELASCCELTEPIQKEGQTKDGSVPILCNTLTAMSTCVREVKTQTMYDYCCHERDGRHEEGKHKRLT